MAIQITPLIITTISFCLGILLGNFFPSRFYLVSGLISLAVFILLRFSVLIKKKTQLLFIFIYLAVALAGAGYYCQRSEVPAKDISRYMPAEGYMNCSVEGTVESFPEKVKNRTGFMLSCDRLMVEGDSFEIRGRTQVNVYDREEVEFNYKDTVIVSGKLYLPYPSTNPGVFDYRNFLSHKGIYTVMSVYSINGIKKVEGNLPGFLPAMIANLHRRIDSIITEAMKDAKLEAMVLKGVMLGRRKELPQEVQDMFIASGVVHTLAVSGLHVGLVTVMFFWLFGLLRCPRKLSYVLTILIIIIYVWITGARPSAVRAAIMVAAGLIAMMLERDKHLYNIVALAALLILLAAPRTLFDVGFQMSFAAVLGILYIMPWLLDVTGFKKIKNRILRWIIACLAVTAGAQVGVYPIIAFYFNKISMVSFLSNIAAVPLVGIVVGLGFAMSITGLVSMSLAGVIGAANRIIIGIFVKYVGFFASLPFAFKYVISPSLLFLVLYYLFFALLPRSGKNRAARKTIFVIPVILVVIFLAGRLFGNRIFSVTFLDVKGDIAHIEFPGRRNVLVYGGYSAPRFNTGKNLMAPYLWKKGIKSIDAVFLTGAGYDSRHMDNLNALFERFPVDVVYHNGCFKINRKGLELVGPGKVVEFGSGSTVRVLNPVVRQEDPLVLRIESHGFRTLLAGTAGKRLFKKINERDLACDALQLTHTGKKTFINDFLGKISFKYAIITNNKPGNGFLESPANMEVFSTACDGAVTIEVRPDGKALVRSYKQDKRRE